MRSLTKRERGRLLARRDPVDPPAPALALVELAKARSHGVVGDALHVEVDAGPDLEPALVLTDIGMPRMNGLDALVRIRSLPARARIVIYTVEQDLDTATEPLRRGASGYVAKTAPFSVLLDALRAALAGSTQVVLR